MIVIDRNYILAVTSTDITNEIRNALDNIPLRPDGYYYRLRADTLEWELVELPPIPEDDEEATAEDYEAALGRFGV